jgi:ribosome-binding ATPase
MSWSCGIVGLPNAGKSTLFKAITAHNVTIASYPFSTVDPNKAIVALTDERLLSLASVCASEKVTPAAIEIIDVAGLVRGASRGEGLGNQFLGYLRNVDLLIHVVSAFEPNPPTGESIKEKIDTINLELILADLETIRRRREKNESKLKSGDKSAHLELDLFARLESHLNEGFPLRIIKFNPDEKNLLDQLSLLTSKEMIYVYNHDEDYNGDDYLSYFGSDPAVAMCGRLEADLVDLLPDERSQFLQAYGLLESKVSSLLQSCFELLRLLTFYTVKGNEARAWVIPTETKASKAAGKIHTDMEKGFINAEVIPWELLAASGSLPAVREKGLSRTEGKDYLIQDGDVLFIRFRQ